MMGGKREQCGGRTTLLLNELPVGLYAVANEYARKRAVPENSLGRTDLVRR
jgi:hypothetical protein